MRAIFCMIAVLVWQAVSAVRPDSVTAPFPTVPVTLGLTVTTSALLSREAYPHGGLKAAAAREHTSRGTGALQFVPMAMPWAMKALGQPTRSSWSRMALSDATSVALTGAVVYSIKSTVTSARPDGTDRRSFPSGHTAWAFAGATIMERELGWASEWYTLGAYTFATGVALERVIDRHHYPTDVVAGAGIGILTTRLGYYITDIIMGRKGLEHTGRPISRDNLNLSYFSLETGLCLPFGPVDFGDGVKLVRLPAISAGLKGGLPVDDNFGIAIEGGVQSTPLLTDVRHDRTNVANLTQVGLILSPYYKIALSRRLGMSFDAGIGYLKNFNINSIDHAVTSDGGSPVGRVNVGAIFRFSDHFSLKASAGCQLSGYSFSIKPSEAYHCNVEAHRSGLSPALLLNISSRYEF